MDYYYSFLTDEETGSEGISNVPETHASSQGCEEIKIQVGGGGGGRGCF